MFKLALFAFVLTVAAAAPIAPVVDVVHPPSYSYSSSFVQHSPPVVKTYAAHPIVPVAHVAHVAPAVVPVASVVKYHAPVVSYPLVKTYAHPLYPTYPVAYKPSPLVYAPHYY